MALVESVIDSLAAVAAGSVDFVAQSVEEALASAVEVNPALDPQIPDAFTPDDASEGNDVFKVEYIDIALIQEFSVYNYWGTADL